MTVSDLLLSLYNTKLAIRRAILNQDIWIPPNTPFKGYADFIRLIDADAAGGADIQMTEGIEIEFIKQPEANADDIFNLSANEDITVSEETVLQFIEYIFMYADGAVNVEAAGKYSMLEEDLEWGTE